MIAVIVSLLLLLGDAASSSIGATGQYSCTEHALHVHEH